jgi:hypothetical protein
LKVEVFLSATKNNPRFWRMRRQFQARNLPTSSRRATIFHLRQGHNVKADANAKARGARPRASRNFTVLFSQVRVNRKQRKSFFEPRASRRLWRAMRPLGRT